ncbi:MAG TPA: NAD(P)H-hydrate dehydratase [Acidimicrobiales bacterium]|nr:NAD(P)H-hydrate dehydratase [Acidimicrobiales bacterium]
MSIEELVSRSGLAVARAALEMLGGAYGRRVDVVAGPGNNGADARDAAARLERRGARVRVWDLDDVPRRLSSSDLLIDGALGTGYRFGERDTSLPRVTGTRVLAVDLPSGLDATTGEAAPDALRADVTCVLAALKPGLVLGRGPDLAGKLRLADIGLDAWTVARAAEVGDEDLARWLPERPRNTHKWERALMIIAGSPGMLGAATLAARAAQRAGAGLVRVGIPGVEDSDLPVMGEALSFALPDGSWADRALADIGRFQAAVIGPGLGRSEGTAAAIRRFVASCPCPLLVDADGLTALGHDAAKVLAGRKAPTLITPHDGEVSRLGGDPSAADRLAEARRLAEALSVSVLWKGPTTVVAGGELLLATSTRDSRLATAGTGDVLAGIAGAFMARGLAAERAGAAAARASIGAAAARPGPGLIAGDLVSGLSRYLATIGAAA